MGSIPPLRTLLTRVLRRLGQTVTHSFGSSKPSQSNSVQLSRLHNSRRRDQETLSQERMKGYGGEYVVMSKSADGFSERPYADRGIHVTTQVEINHADDIEKGGADEDARLAMPMHRF
ncbi:MAG: hypothetical protein Q9165_007932 [Trypethelium subeluteriae]